MKLQLILLLHNFISLLINIQNTQERHNICSKDNIMFSRRIPRIKNDHKKAGSNNVRP